MEEELQSTEFEQKSIGEGTFLNHLHYMVDTAEEALEEGVKFVLTRISHWLLFLQAQDDWEESCFRVSVKRLTVATSNKTFKCTFQRVHKDDTSEQEMPDSPTNISGRPKLVSFHFGETNGNDISPQEDNDESVILRVYGRDSGLLVDRQHELEMIKVFSEMRLGGRLYATFDNGCVTEYVKGSVLSIDDLKKPETSTKIATKLAEIHRVNLPQNLQRGEFKGIWRLIHQWLDVVQGLYNANEVMQISKEVATVQEALKPYASHVALTHNDLNHGNIIYDHQNNKITFVDLEFAQYSDVGFDIGNHFCEWAGLELKFSEYPSKRQQLNFLRHYLATFKALPLDQVEENQL